VGLGVFKGMGSSITDKAMAEVAVGVACQGGGGSVCGEWQAQWQAPLYCTSLP
jgi:hypothetical protein